ncbi:MAG: hypothetical protein BGP16_00645 [Sphingobium sp. 66-54]|nr:MAG: hypothetical protein BGP16_00645 [Sphingobium sp. 66-54]
MDYEIERSLRGLAEKIGDEIAVRLVERFRQGELPVAPEYLTAFQVAQLTGFTPKGLENMRAKRIGPPFMKVGNSVRYRVADVRAWMDAGGDA